jgi:hypothetical protein
MGDKCDRVQVSLILVILIQYSKRDIGDNCGISITKMSDTCTLSQLSPMSLLLYCISITKMSDTCTLSQLSLMSLTVLTVIEYRYHSSW